MNLLKLLLDFIHFGFMNSVMSILKELKIYLKRDHKKTLIKH